MRAVAVLLAGAWALCAGAGEPISTIDTGATVAQFDISPDGKKLAYVRGAFTSPRDTSARVVDLATGAELLKFSDTGDLMDVEFSADGTRLVTGGFSNRVRVWNAEDGSQVAKYRMLVASVLAVAFAPDGLYVASGTADGYARSWMLEDGWHFQSQLIDHGGKWVNAVTYSPDGKHTASGGMDNTIRVWDESWDDDLRKAMPTTGGVLDLAYSPDGKLLAGALDDTTAQVFNTADQKLKVTLEGHTKSVRSIAFSPDGTMIATASADNTVKLWSLEGKVLRTIEAHDKMVTCVQFLPDGDIVTSSTDGTIKIWGKPPPPPPTPAPPTAEPTPAPPTAVPTPSPPTPSPPLPPTTWRTPQPIKIGFTYKSGLCGETECSMIRASQCSTVVSWDGCNKADSCTWDIETGGCGPRSLSVSCLMCWLIFVLIGGGVCMLCCSVACCCFFMMQRRKQQRVVVKTAAPFAEPMMATPLHPGGAAAPPSVAYAPVTVVPPAAAPMASPGAPPQPAGTGVQQAQQVGTQQQGAQQPDPPVVILPVAPMPDTSSSEVSIDMSPPPVIPRRASTKPLSVLLPPLNSGQPGRGTRGSPGPSPTGTNSRASSLLSSEDILRTLSKSRGRAGDVGMLRVSSESVMMPMRMGGGARSPRGASRLPEQLYV